MRVPVLSEQIQDVEPRVSTPSKFLTKTFSKESLFAVKESPTVIVASKPSGTFATIIPIAKTRFVIAPIKKDKN